MMAWRCHPPKLLFLALIGFLTLTSTLYLLYRTTSGTPISLPPLFGSHGAQLRSHTEFYVRQLPPVATYTPKVHPVRELIERETARWDAVRESQSKTLAEAVGKYRARHGIPPPPHFDKWFHLAKNRSVVLIDEYDSVMDSLLPFWAVSPRLLRERARETLGHDNVMTQILVRDGRVAGELKGWQQKATAGMMASFVEWLPDMDLVFNRHDEPRVIVPDSDLSRYVAKAQSKLRSLGSIKHPKNAWSPPPADTRYTEVPPAPTTSFNRFSHQSTWTQARLSCPPDSPVRSLEENAADNTTAFEYSDLHLIANKTAFSEVCNSPSLQRNFGFFERPNALDFVQELYPIFSQSKVSSCQDILYPSPWYWAERVPFDVAKGKPWEAKENKLYWRGGTTGGWTEAGGWRRQHRQSVVHNVHHGNTSVRVYNHGGPDGGWNLTTASPRDFADLFDVHFSHIAKHCGAADCAEMAAYFDIRGKDPQDRAWNYKYLLDVDGFAFSGRFYAFMRSASAVFKAALFREWHDGDGWLRPWVHYVPVSFSAHEYAELLRYFDREPEGRAAIRRMADGSRAWAAAALRNEDMEVWFFRLLLEYGRLVDDDRDNLGFELPK